jgi:hypothetical protein
MVTAKDIETDLWHNIIDLLTKDDWKIIDKYDNMDVGIDYDSVRLKKGEEEILFEWTNWFEGEIKCNTIERLRQIEELVGQKFGRVI